MVRKQVEVAPSILAANFARLGEEIQSVEQGGARLVHVDVMDGRFVPNISIGVPVVASLRKATRLPLDVHLMIIEPERYVEAFAEAGASNVTVHQEATRHLERVLSAIQQYKTGQDKIGAGVAINPATPVAALEEVLERVDVVLVMSVNPGFGGQSFLPVALRKIQQLRELRERYNYSYRIEVDGGITAGNAAEAVRAGADILVVGTSVFHTPDAAAAVRTLKQVGVEALAQKV
jgi:ribulose-phosphate 3-epimerase